MRSTISYAQRSKSAKAWISLTKGINKTKVILLALHRFARMSSSPSQTSRMKRVENKINLRKKLKKNSPSNLASRASYRRFRIHARRELMHGLKSWLRCLGKRVWRIIRLKCKCRRRSKSSKRNLGKYWMKDNCSGC